MVFLVTREQNVADEAWRDEFSLDSSDACSGESDGSADHIKGSERRRHHQECDEKCAAYPGHICEPLELPPRHVLLFP